MGYLNIQRTVFKTSDFLSWQQNGTLELSPSFQRRPVWSASAKSYLIDTIVKGLPIPIIFIREQIDLKTLAQKRQIVDGQQRIRTVLSYIKPGCLKDYNPSRDYFQIKKIHNKDLSNKNFEDLPLELKHRIFNYQFSVHILPIEANDQQVLQIFARMNSTGVNLNNQELRNATYFGEFKNVMYNLGLEQLDRWRKWRVFTENDISRMQEVETTSELVQLIIYGISTKSKKFLDDLYESFEEDFPNKSVIIERFRKVMDSIEDTLGDKLPRLDFNKRTLFYYLFSLLYDIHYSLNSKLIRKPVIKIPRDFSKKILEIDTLFKEEKLPERILSVVTRRSVESVRKEIFNYLKKKIGYD